MTALETLVTDMGAKLDRIAEVILGDPTNADKPGVMIRLDRLERSNYVKTRMMWILASGLLIAAGNALLTIL